MVRHAIASEEKQARREVILEAASALLMAGDGSLPSAAQIASASGLAKGTVYLYFRTKEEIFIALLLEGLGKLLSAIGAEFEGTKGRRGDKVAAFLRTYIDHLKRHPELLRLDALGYGVLERNLDPTKMREFKLTFVARLIEAGIVVEESLRLTRGHGSKLLMRTFALTRGLWQSSRPLGEAAAVLEEPVLALIYPDFEEELIGALTEYWRGALAAG